MDYIKKYDFDIETVTPVHIGSGDSYLSSECLFSGRDYKRIDISKYFRLLIKDNPDEQEEFIKNLSENKFIPKDLPGDYTKYYISKQFQDDDFKNNNEIKENIKVFNKPYIPGSSIKGAIRTALLYNSFKDEDIDKLFVDGKSNDTLIKSYFSVEDSAQKDILRFLQIKDSTTIDKPLLYKVFKRKPKKKGGFVKGIPVYLESIYLENATLSSSLITTYDDKTFNTMGFDSEKTEMLKLKNIKTAINNFTNDLIQHEIQFCKDNKLFDLKKFYENLDNDEDAPLLKIGHGSGFLATTIGLKIKDKNPVLFKEIKEFIIEDEKRKNEEKNINKDFPIMRTVLESEKDGTLGWVKLKFKD